MKQSEKAEQSVIVATPAGYLEIFAKNGAVTRILSALQENEMQSDAADPVLKQAAREMAEYFEGKRQNFSFAMQPEGTPFQRLVWEQLLRIPYGETRTYGEVARAVGNPNASRAVGMACNRNPIWIAVPCHRVVGAKGSLTGYALGLGMKRRLLDLERDNRK